MGTPPHQNQTGHPVLGVGSRVLVACRGTGADRVTLMDATGTSALATVADGIEVEILAWSPRRGAETRYRVVPTKGGVEGWLGAGSLRARPPAPVPIPPPAVSSARLASPKRAPAVESPPARRPRPATASVVRKTTTAPRKKTRKGTR
jgi:hypothetical protein